MVVRAILFDYGGTLDGGVHWLERFIQLYDVAGLDFPRERIRAAFDHATRCAYGDPAVAVFGLEALIEYHVARQREQLGFSAPAAAAIVAGFVRAARAGLAESRVLLSRLRQRVALGVVSNFYGNVHRVSSRRPRRKRCCTLATRSRRTWSVRMQRACVPAG